MLIRPRRAWAIRFVDVGRHLFWRATTTTNENRRPPVFFLGQPGVHPDRNMRRKEGACFVTQAAGNFLRELAASYCPARADRAATSGRGMSAAGKFFAYHVHVMRGWHGLPGLAVNSSLRGSLTTAVCSARYSILAHSAQNRPYHQPNEENIT